MSAKERDRLKVLHEVKQRHITQKQAGIELGLSVRWIRKLLLRWRAGGDSALRHGSRATVFMVGNNTAHPTSQASVPVWAGTGRKCDSLDSRAFHSLQLQKQESVA